ncbi:MAG: histidine kinase N-terminal 7TM domain-containing protein [Lachnospiraceae bacterium]|nr:histidine kinase N-terminal 7TM domain-containing protein [Lachnospiraceae bacterium]
MLQGLLTIQYVGMALLVAELVYVIIQKPSKIQKTMTLLIISMLLTFVGYSLELQATNLKEAMMAIKINYLGKPFVVLSTFIMILDYCSIVLPKLVYALLFTIQTGISFSVFFYEKTKLFYSSVSFTEDGLFPHVVLGHGILYHLYIVVVSGYTISMLGVCIWKSKRVKTEREKRQLALFASGTIACFVALLVYMTGVLRGYDCTLLGYLYVTFILSFSYIRLGLFDVTTLAQEQVVEHIDTGIVVYDNSWNLIYQNGQAKFLNIESKVKELADSGELFFRRDRAYRVVVQPVEKKGVRFGMMYVISDVTDSYNDTERLERMVEEKTKHIRTIQRKTTLGMADMIESRDSSTGGHVKRTSEVVKILVEELKRCETCNADRSYPDSFYNDVIMAAPMHDLGKIAVDDAVLRKPGKFIDKDYAQMKTHAQKGARIVEQVLRGIEDDEFLKIAINIAHFHHEKWDGTGYPTGRKGEDIPYEARIMALADVFDALVSKRCYKDSMPYEKAFQIIEESLGSHFDEELGRHFLDCRNELIEYYEATEH